MAGFRRSASGVSARFRPPEAGLLRALIGQVTELLGADPDRAAPGAGGPSPDELPGLDGLAGPSAPPIDPVLARLFPSGYTDDEEAAADFRRYTEPGLRSAKLAAARTVLDTLPADGGRVRLSGEEAQAWLRTLNDLRLALGVRLGITEDYQDELADVSADDARSAYFHIYDWLTYVQETLVRALW